MNVLELVAFLFLSNTFLSLLVLSCPFLLFIFTPVFWWMGTHVRADIQTYRRMDEQTTQFLQYDVYRRKKGHTRTDKHLRCPLELKALHALPSVHHIETWRIGRGCKFLNCLPFFLLPTLSSHFSALSGPFRFFTKRKSKYGRMDGHAELNFIRCLQKKKSQTS